MRKKRIYILSVSSILRDIHILERTHPSDQLAFWDRELIDHVKSHGRTKTPTYLGFFLGAAEENDNIIELPRCTDRWIVDQESKEYVYVSDDDYYLNELPSWVTTISVAQFESLIEKDNWARRYFLEPTIESVKKDRKLIVKSQAIGLVSMLAIIFIASPPVQSFLRSVFPPIATFFAAGFFGVGLYMFRCRWRTYYGVLEMAFGMLVATNFIYPVHGDIWPYIQMMGGVYIVVRGLDNLNHGPLSTTRYWKLMFPRTSNSNA